MKLNIDWKGLLKAVLRAALPFLAGAVGGMVGGCGAEDGAVVGRELSGAMTRRERWSIRQRWARLLRGRWRSICDINETER